MTNQIFKVKVGMAKPSFKGTVTDGISNNSSEFTKASELIDFVKSNFKKDEINPEYNFEDIENVVDKDKQEFFIAPKDENTGKVKDNFSGNTLDYKIMGMLIDFFIKNHIPADKELDLRAIAAEKKAEMEKNKKEDFVFPPRTEIKDALLKVSNFTPEEIEIMSWSTMYKCYSLIERYRQNGVEEELRKEEWFQPALEEAKKEKAKENLN